MDKIHVLEMIHRYDGQSVHIMTRDGKFYTGMLNVIPGEQARTLSIGWREDEVKSFDVTEIHPV